VNRDDSEVLGGEGAEDGVHGAGVGAHDESR
jgi:hypothetical protein